MVRARLRRRTIAAPAIFSFLSEATMSISLRHFSSTDILVRLPELGALLQDCVHDGASIGFILPFDASASQAFWTDNVLPAVARGVRLLLVAEVDGRVAGAVQLDRSEEHTSELQSRF